MLLLGSLEAGFMYYESPSLSFLIGLVVFFAEHRVA
jgi:hypothetical protein